MSNPRAKSLARADIEALLREGGERIERQLPRDFSAPDDEPGPAIQLRELVEYLRMIALYAPFAAEELSDEVAYVDGSAWRRWIVDLKKVCEESKLPHGAGRELRASGEPSEFITLVAALMKTLPPELRRHDGTVAALAKAIGEARSQAEKRQTIRERANSGD